MAGEKRSAPETAEFARKESAILLDIEGTTSSISFVKDTLFPYVREFLKTHVDEKWSDEEFKADFAKLKEQAKDDEEKKIDGFVPIKEDTEEEAKESLIQYVLWQMDNDRKTGALKQLQAHIWKAAHKPIKGHVYDDVPKAFEAWTSIGKKLYVYSSGSVEAQKLLFGNSIHGDLLKYINGHFDTEIGPKQEAESYKHILKKIGFESSDVLFLTDVVKEAEAAKAAGLSTTIVIRKGNTELSDLEKSSFKTIESFSELSFQTSSKRQKLEEGDNVIEKKENDTKEKKVVSTTTESACEFMDTPEDMQMTVDEAKTDAIIESKIENLTKEKEILKGKSIENVEKNVIPMDAETIPEEKITTGIKTEIEKLDEIVKKEPNKSAEKITENTVKEENDVLKEKSIEVSVVEKNSTEAENKEQKSEETKKASAEITEETNIDIEKKVEESASIINVVEKEKMSETITAKVVETVTEKITEKVAEKFAEEVTEKAIKTVTEEKIDAKKVEDTKLEKKDINAEEKKSIDDIKENGETKISESVENKVDESENKENVQSVEEVAKVEKKAETETEKADEANETKDVESVEKENKIETEKEISDKAKLDDDTSKEAESKKLNGTTTNGDPTKDVSDEKLHSNGVSNESEKTKENGDTEESIKVKKAVADGAGEPNVVSPPVVTATS